MYGASTGMVPSLPAGTPFHAKKTSRTCPWEFDPGDTLSHCRHPRANLLNIARCHQSIGYRFNALDDSIGFATDTGELSRASHRHPQRTVEFSRSKVTTITMLREGPYPRFLQGASCPKGTSPTTRPPKPRENLLPIAPKSSSPCISAGHRPTLTVQTANA